MKVFPWMVPEPPIIRKKSCANQLFIAPRPDFH
jgi:hypothetical protein